MLVRYSICIMPTPSEEHSCAGNICMIMNSNRIGCAPFQRNMVGPSKVWAGMGLSRVNKLAILPGLCLGPKRWETLMKAIRKGPDWGVILVTEPLS